MKKIFKYLSLGILPLIIAGLAGCANPNELIFEYKTPKDSLIKYEMITSSKQDINQNGKSQKMSTEMSMNFSEKVTDITESGEKLVTYTFSNVQLTAERDGKKETQPMEQMNGKTSTVKMTKAGKIIERDGTEVEENNSKDNFTPVFPEGLKKVGETWDVNIENEAPMGPAIKMVSSIKSNYNFVGYEKLNNVDYARVDEKITINQNLVKEGDMSKMPVDFNKSVTASGEGYFLYDYKKGIIVKSDRKMKIKSEMSAEQKQVEKGKKPQKETTSVTEELTISLNLVSDNPAELEKTEGSASVPEKAPAEEAPAAEKAPAEKDSK